MIVIFEKVFTLFAFAAAGYALAKLGLVNKDHSKALSVLLVYVFMPCNVLKTYAANFNPTYIAEKWPIIVVSSVVVVIIALLSHGAARWFSKDNYERKVYAYILAIANIGYMGFPIAEHLMGSSGLMNAMMCALPMYTLYIYTIGFCNLTKRKVSLRNLVNPAFVPIVIGAILGLSQLPLPDVAWSIFKTGSACMGPVSMLMAGIVVSGFKLKPLLLNRKAYIVTALRLIIIPILLGVCLMWIPDKDIVKTIVLLYAMPCGMNTIVFPKLVGENCEIGAGQALISNIAAVATIPVVLSLFGM